MKIAVLTAAYALPVTAHAQNQTDIFHHKQLSAQAFFSVLTNDCAYSSAEVDIAQQGYKETGNVTHDKFNTSSVLVYLNYTDICDQTKSWYLVGETNTGNVKINGSGQKVFASGSAASMRLDGQNGSGANITDFATVSIDAQGSIVFSMDDKRTIVSRFGSSKNLTTKVDNSSDSGPATNLNVTLLLVTLMLLQPVIWLVVRSLQDNLPFYRCGNYAYLCHVRIQPEPSPDTNAPRQN